MRQRRPCQQRGQRLSTHQHLAKCLKGFLCLLQPQSNQAKGGQRLAMRTVTGLP